MKKIGLLAVTSSVVIALTACSSQTDERVKVKDQPSKSEEAATVTIHKEASNGEQELDNEAAQSLIKLFKSIEKGNVSEVTKQVAFFNEVTESDKEDAKKLITEWQEYDFLHNAELIPVLESDMTQETLDLYKGNGVTRVIVAMKYKGNAGNRLNKAFYMEEQEDGEFLLNGMVSS